MNQQNEGRDQDHGWSDPAEAGLLKQTFGAMADGVDPASPTGPAAAMTAMSRRVRRRRTAKLGGLGGGALALAGALVLGAGQLAPSQPSELLPGESSPASDFRLQDGYQPPWLDWSDLTCGMPVTDLETTAPGWSVTSSGDIYGRTADLEDPAATSWGMASTLEKGQGSLDVAPVLVWSRDGVVLDLGPNVFETPGEQSEPLLGGGPGAVAAAGASASTCSPTSTDLDPVYEATLPEGDYEVRVVAFPEVALGTRATAVSEPVPVRVDADGAHSPGAAPGDSTIAFPEPAEGQVSRFELDRTTDWVTAEMTQRGYSSDTPMRVIGQCEGPDPEAVLPIELVQPSTAKVVGTTQISCDGNEAGADLTGLDGGGEVIDIRLPSVPDGVTRLWVSLEPATPIGGDGGPECSSTGFEPKYVPGNSVTGSTSATAGSIVIAAMDCDIEALVALVKESRTESLDGGGTPEQVFALPEPDAGRYRELAAVLTDTRAVIVDEGSADATVVWPRVAADEFRDSNEAWAEVVAAGLLTAEEADAQRAGGYQGVRVGMNMAGDWLSYSVGD
ncbi:hypothetical protein [Promicromonospora iranensis]|uniref:Uncharacterized protein n=1 Tax=Promicromonospora iranensis TaxID=1105144 RepID=A0ABU2CNK8_9MICO|nr:hypothetical protein [Promicromonospora iranensis]MDR7382927.1 hypothetical protein [Promicromonospora iranensis]